MIIGVASGKGGTGKTTVAVNLAYSAPQPTQLLDCDVEEPNCHLFFDSQTRRREAVCIPVPELDASRCNGCGLCRQICQFHAVTLLGGKPLLFPDLCHGCGGCTLVCPMGAIREVGSEIGIIEEIDAGPGTLIYGRLHVGKALSPPLIRAVKRHARPDQLTVIDSPPGTACPLAAAISGCDYALLVAEPTPFGLHDLGLVVESVRQLKVPCGVVINRAQGESTSLRDFCQRQGLPVLMEIPESHAVATAQGRGRLATAEDAMLRSAFIGLWKTIFAAVATPGETDRGVYHANL